MMLCALSYAKHENTDKNDREGPDSQPNKLYQLSTDSNGITDFSVKGKTNNGIHGGIQDTVHNVAIGSSCANGIKKLQKATDAGSCSINKKAAINGCQSGKNTGVLDGTFHQAVIDGINDIAKNCGS